MNPSQTAQIAGSTEAQTEVPACDSQHLMRRSSIVLPSFETYSSYSQTILLVLFPILEMSKQLFSREPISSKKLSLRGYATSSTKLKSELIINIWYCIKDCFFFTVSCWSRRSDFFELSFFFFACYSFHSSSIDWRYSWWVVIFLYISSWSQFLSVTVALFILDLFFFQLRQQI